MLDWKTLPQAPHISDETAETWIKRVQDLEGENHRIEWHLKRLRGFGGSEIGVLVKELEGETDFFTSANQIVRQKLMREYPSGDNGDLRRGRVMESIIQNIFRQKYSAEPLESVMREMGEVCLHGWQVGNVDDLVRIDGRVYIVDFKAPAQVTNHVEFGYSAQLHHYAPIVEAVMGRPVDGFLLVKHDYKEWDVKALVVPINPALSEKIVEAGNHYWNMVLNGVEPTKRRPSSGIVVNDVDADFLSESRRNIEGRLASILVMKKVLTEMESGLKEDLEVLSLKTNSKPELLQSRVTKTIKDDTLKQFIVAHGKDVDDYMVPGDHWNVEKMALKLQMIGEDMLSYKIPELDEKKVEAFADSVGFSLAEFRESSMSFFLPKGTVPVVEETKEECREILENFLSGQRNCQTEELDDEFSESMGFGLSS